LSKEKQLSLMNYLGVGGKLEMVIPRGNPRMGGWIAREESHPGSKRFEVTP
jgi:hypothetical protein